MSSGRSRKRSKKEILFGIVGDILGVDPRILNLGLSKEKLESWDSLAQVQIIAEIEEEFAVSIPIEEVSQINTLGDFYSYIRKNHSK